jgi:hypothetical protein
MNFEDYKVGTKVLSAAHQQPGTVTRVYRRGHSYPGADYFEVTWDRHPNSAPRRYWNAVYRQEVLHILADNEKFFGRVDWPTIVEETPKTSSVTVVDTFAVARQSLQEALGVSLVETPEGNPGVDLNKFIVALSERGWSIPK